MKQQEIACLDPAVCGKIKKAFRRHVFRLIYEGYLRMKKRPKDYSRVIEEDISHDLCDESRIFGR